MEQAQEAQGSLPRTAAATSPENPWPLRVLSEKLKAHIENSPESWVEGQLLEANVRNGHAYLVMRDVDVDYSFSVTVWASVMRSLDSAPEVGSRVVARVKPSFYAKTGRLSLNAFDLRPVGLGDLLARLERLRRALFDEGLFDASRKKKLPLLPNRIGLITGRDSDAEKDVIRNASLRWPAVRFDIRNTAVQGVNAVGEVMAALRELDANPDIDVIIIARGGGALEDLLPFSSEELVRAVAACTTPVVSAIGHEADRPILDDVADLRASTPTDAAKRVVPDLLEELNGIAQARHRLDRAVRQNLERESQRIASLRARPVLANPHSMVQLRREDLARLSQRSTYSMRGSLARGQDAIAHLRAQVRALSPQQTLDRGYSVLQLADGQVVRARGPGPRGNRRFGAPGPRPAHRHHHDQPVTRRRNHSMSAEAKNPDVAQLSYEQAREELVAVVAQLEAGAATLEQSLGLWERGEALAARCEAWLQGASRAWTPPAGSRNPRTPANSASHAGQADSPPRIDSAPSAGGLLRCPGTARRASLRVRILQALLLVLDVERGRGPLRVDFLQRLAQQRRHGQARVPLPVRGDHVPRGDLRVGAVDRHLVGVHVVVPEQPLVDVPGVELPVLVRALEALRQPGALLVLGDVHHDLDDLGVVGDQPGLELVDRVVAALQLGLVGISADLVDQHVLVVRAVEDADVAGARQLLLDAPEEVVGASPPRWAP